MPNLSNSDRERFNDVCGTAATMLSGELDAADLEHVIDMLSDLHRVLLASEDSDGVLAAETEVGNLYQLPREFENEGDFDSVATADAIEGELSDMTTLDSAFPDPKDDSPFADLSDLDNVIPISPNTGENHESVSDAASQTAPSTDGSSSVTSAHVSWVGLDDSAAQSAEQEREEDPWAHMRPSEEPKPEGIWSKFFGGEERKIAKANRGATPEAEPTEPTEPTGSTEETEAMEQLLDSSFDSTCLNCGGQYEVDLGDPIGQNVRVSCPTCDHLWFPSSIIDSQTG